MPHINCSFREKENGFNKNNYLWGVTFVKTKFDRINLPTDKLKDFISEMFFL